MKVKLSSGYIFCSYNLLSITDFSKTPNFLKYVKLLSMIKSWVFLPK